MPLKTNIGVSRKVADNNYGSRGASVNLEVELDSTLINDPERFHDRIRQVFRLAQQAIDEELNRQQQGNGTTSHTTNSATNSQAAQPSHNDTNGNGSPANGHRNGSNGNGHRISEKQLSFIRTLAGGIRGLGVRRLAALASKMFNKPLADLSSLDGSGLIDVLKDVKAGKIDIEAALNGAAA